MSLRKKLLSLIDKIEDLDLEAEAEEVLEEEIDELVEEPAPEEPPPTFVEVPYEECAQVLAAQKAALEARATLADVVFQYERTKQHLISKIEEYHEELRMTVATLRDQNNLPTEVDYTFTIPEVGEAGSFELKKE